MKTKPNLLLLLLLLLIESIRAAGVTAPFFPLSIRKLITSVPPPPRMQPFIYTALPSRVIFGSGTVSKARAEIAALGCSKALILTTPGQAAMGERVEGMIGDFAVGIYSNATMHTPMSITKDALSINENLGADCVVSIGGGSTIGLGKALALHSSGKLKHVAIPTTYAGSEATPILGQTETDSKGETVKTTQKTLLVLPQTIICDWDFTVSLPAQMTITSGINSIAHAVEALYSVDANPITSNLALQGIGAIARSLPVLLKEPSNVDARSKALFGAWCGGTVLGAVGMSLHHKICHTLGGSFGIPHAETHAVILPHTVAYNQPYAITAMQRIADALGVTNAAQGLYDLAKDNEAPFSLKALGFKKEDLSKAADIVCRTP